ncbi:MAG: hypothetical protein IRY85_05870 [Micromonosporaceae bacterium]|nr:hypothetical protein [Micromonosporaceae bacterium]
MFILSFAAVLVVVAGAVGLAIWNARDQEEVAEPTGLETSFDPLGETRAEILAAFDGYLRAATEANRRGDPYYDGLELYTDGVLRLQITQSIISRNEDGSYYIGELKSEATVESIDLDAEPPTATISACIDATDYRLVYREDNSPVPGAGPWRRYMAEAIATMNTDGRWLIVANAAQMDQPC